MASPTNGLTALALAAVNGFEEIADLLMQAGENPWQRLARDGPGKLARANEHRLTLLPVAKVHGFEGIVRLFERQMQFYEACHTDNCAVAPPLLVDGARIEGVSHSRAPPLHNASDEGRTEMVAFLLSHGPP